MSRKKKDQQLGDELLESNRRARHEYEILEELDEVIASGPLVFQDEGAEAHVAAGVRAAGSRVPLNTGPNMQGAD